MKIKTIALLLVAVLCFSLTACGESEAKRPIDYPNSKWSCDVASITFSVSDDGKIIDATMVDKDDNTLPISIVFSDTDENKVTITNADETETYLSGTFTSSKDKFVITVTDIYNTNLSISSRSLIFKRS
ncbi:MAG: hypothetical protein E7586_02545 [Ruminococcaceae bacterium]|nr:hypothetical protein [Oscillospiraceae bacterium]